MAKTGGYLYAITAQGTGLVKIGTATNVEKRLKNLQTGQPYLLQILAMIPVETDVYALEHLVHRFLATERQRGEWFSTTILDNADFQELIARAIAWGVAETQQEEEQEYPSTHSDAIGERLRYARQKQGYSLRALADIAQVPVSTLSAVETGQRSGHGLTLETSKRLAVALQANLHWLAFGSGPATFRLGPPSDREGSVGQAMP